MVPYTVRLGPIWALFRSFIGPYIEPYFESYFACVGCPIFSLWAALFPKTTRRGRGPGPMSHDKTQVPQPGTHGPLYSLGGPYMHPLWAMCSEQLTKGQQGSSLEKSSENRALYIASSRVL